MKKAAKKAGRASSKWLQSTSRNDETIMTPTIIKAGAVAAGTIPINGKIRIERRKRTAVVTAVRPVRPPAEIPAADSTYVVVFEVPNSAPIEYQSHLQRAPCPS